MNSNSGQSPDDLQAAVNRIEWYHTIDLGPGIVTPGWLDHRSVLDKLPLPTSLAGKRCLDVGTFNGFWAFEMERRGGTVTGVDVLDPTAWDWPLFHDQETIDALGRRMEAGDGFEIARTALGSTVERLERSVYDLDPDDIGTFDFVYLGSLLIHLRDPIRALERVHSVCSGTLLVVDGIDLPLTLKAPRTPASRFDGKGRPWWWWPNQAGLTRMVEAGGFELTATPSRLYVPPGRGWPTRRWNPNGLRSREGRAWLTTAWLGDPHAVILARPRAAR